MKGKLRDLFTFSSGERKGILSLVFMLIIICSLKVITVLHHPVPVANKYPDWMKDTLAFEETNDNTFAKNESFAENFPSNDESAEQQKIIDPNHASLEDMILAGFSLRVSRTIIHYREKGGRFKTTDDLKKIYGLTPEAIQSVSGNIRINIDGSSQANPTRELPPRININLADTVLLEKLPGIGPVLARRIIRYRALLGGFSSAEQIKEVYGVTDSLFNHIGDRLEADSAHINRISLNSSDEKVLARHPYIGKYVAAGIVQYRAHHGKILNINELTTNGLIEKDRFNKVKFYLSL